MKTLTASMVVAPPCTFLKLLLCGAAAALWATPGTVTATLGNYPNTTVPLSGNTTVTPNVAPFNVASINVSISTDFKGRLEGNPGTGVVRVTDAHPAGTYLVTVTGFGPGDPKRQTFTLTVTTPGTCNPVTFAAATNFDAGAEPITAGVGDFNRDGQQDLAVTNLNSAHISVLLGNGAGSFSAATNFGVGIGPSRLEVGDFNGDGNQDLTVNNQSSNDVSVLLGNGAGNFGTATNFNVGSVPISVAVGDFNGDRKQDLAVANNDSSNVSILLGNGAGSFSAATNFGVASAPYFVLVGEFNGDSNQDLAVACRSSDFVSVLLGDGAGSFGAATNFNVGSTPISVAVGDFNSDGNQDLVVANFDSNNVSVLLGNGGGTFTAATNINMGNAPAAVAVGDFNGDGLQDLAVANFNSNNVLVLFGNGAGGFGTATNFNVGSAPTSVAVGDFNGDGMQDLATANRDSSNVSAVLGQCIAVTPTPTPSPTLTPTPTPTPTPTATATPTATPTATSTPPSGNNISTRGSVGTGDNVVIGGFIIAGNAPRRTMVRAIGPSLANSGISNALADPTLDLLASGGSLIRANDNWRDSQQAEIEATGIPPRNDLEAAIVATLSPGSYTTTVRGKNQGSGVALLEVYDLDVSVDSRLANISTRALVLTGDNVLIGGFMLGGSPEPRRVIARAIGPSLARSGLTNVLADPTLSLRNSNGDVIASNDNWKDDEPQAHAIKIIGLGPIDNRESALLTTLPPGPYTAIVAGQNGGIGIGLVEIYNLP